MAVRNALTNGIKSSKATEQQIKSLRPLCRPAAAQQEIKFSQQNRSNASPTLVQQLVVA